MVRPRKAQAKVKVAKEARKVLRAAELAADEGDGASEQEPEGLDYEAEYAHAFEVDEQSGWSEQEGEIRLSMFVVATPCPEPIVELTSFEPCEMLKTLFFVFRVTRRCGRVEPSCM